VCEHPTCPEQYSNKSPSAPGKYQVLRSASTPTACPVFVTGILSQSAWYLFGKNPIIPSIAIALDALQV
jgi:hypothetical protein